MFSIHTQKLVHASEILSEISVLKRVYVCPCSGAYMRGENGREFNGLLRSVLLI